MNMPGFMEGNMIESISYQQTGCEATSYRSRCKILIRFYEVGRSLSEADSSVYSEY